MAVLVIPSWYPTADNPYNGNFIRRHVEVLAQKQEVVVLYFSSELRDELHIEDWHNGRIRFIHVHYPKKKSKIGQFYSLRKAFKQAVKSISDIELIHVHVLLDRGLIGIWAKKHFGKAMLVTEHGSYLLRENFRKLSPQQKLTIRQSLKQASGLSVVSEVLQEEVKDLYPGKTFITPNVVQRDLFSIAAKNPAPGLNFVHISTLEAVKNVSEIIRGFELFAENFPDFTLRIIHEKENEAIRQQIEASAIRDKIRFSGPHPIEAIARIMQESDALVMLSSYETFSCVIAEAWSCGKAVITTPVGIARNMPPGAGIPVTEAKAEALLAALNDFVEQKERFDSHYLRSLSEAFSEAAVSRAFEEFYASV